VGKIVKMPKPASPPPDQDQSTVKYNRWLELGDIALGVKEQLDAAQTEQQRIKKQIESTIANYRRLNGQPHQKRG
jgi:hypothetical protein